MIALLTLLIAGGLGEDPSPARFEFVDAAGPVAGLAPRFRQWSLGDSPPRPLAGAPAAGPGVQFGLARVGNGPKSALGFVWQPEAKILWLDADGDSKLSANERHSFNDKTISLPATINIGTASLPRTIIFKRGVGTNLYGAVRGYTRGTLRLGQYEFPAALTDGDADGCFDSPGEDRIWIDLNRDSVFDPIDEQFPLGSPVSAGGKKYFVQPDASGLLVRVRERGSETGRLSSAVALRPGASLQKLEASLVSEYGEWAVVKSTEPVALPTGRYRVESLAIQAADSKGRVWIYRFRGQRQYGFSIEAGKDVSVDLLDGLTLSTGVSDESARPGSYIQVAPMWQTPAGVYLTECEVNGSMGGAGIALVDSGDTVLDRATSGFL